jgi:hypothetical protein
MLRAERGFGDEVGSAGVRCQGVSSFEKSTAGFGRGWIVPNSNPGLHQFATDLMLDSYVLGLRKRRSMFPFDLFAKAVWQSRQSAPVLESTDVPPHCGQASASCTASGNNENGASGIAIGVRAILNPLVSLRFP